MNRRGFFILALVILLAGGGIWLWLNEQGKWMSASVLSSNGSNYSVEIPETMTEADFNPNASFQYYDAGTDLSVMVIDDSRQQIASYGLDYDLETYMKIATRQLDSAGMYVNTRLSINENSALQTTIRGKSKGRNSVYLLTCIESGSYYYQVVIWTAEEFFEKNKPVMEKILLSFQEQNPQS